MVRLRAESGFLLIETMVAMSVMLIALSALIVVFSTALLASSKGEQRTTASFLADAQMEAYTGMVSRDIGIDTSASVDSTYKNDAACVNAGTTCSGGISAVETGPTGATPNTCTQINTWYTTTLPCNPSRTVSSATTPASPDGGTYRVDTYIIQLASYATSPGVRTRKQVTVVVRDKSLNVLLRESKIFDCATGVVPSSTDC